jgi:Holliday junction resolvase RusA-like endonuclease
MPIPERVNGIWKQGRGHTRISDKHRDDKAQSPVRFRHIQPLDGPTRALILWVRERRIGDTDSRIKATLDLLIGVAYPDDASVADLRIIRVDDGSEAPRVEIIVTPCAEPTMATWRAAAVGNFKRAAA